MEGAVLSLFTPLGFHDPISQFGPAAVCVGFLMELWWTGELYGVQRWVFVAWFVIALGLELASRGPWMWIAGYVGQVALAIALVLKNQLDNIF